MAEQYYALINARNQEIETLEELKKDLSLFEKIKISLAIRQYRKCPVAIV